MSSNNLPRGELFHLQSQLEQAMDLIAKSQNLGEQESYESTTKGTAISEFAKNDSLLARCESIVNSNRVRKKPQLRVLHQQACSGGSLISKCLAAMPNTFVFSEIHPNTAIHLSNRWSDFRPTDVSTLSRLAKVPNGLELCDKIMLESIKASEEHISQFGGNLIVREHSHSDYFIGSETKERSSLVALLESHFDIKSLVTIRNPVDSYLSIKKNRWVHFTPANFDEYCRRYLLFLKEFKKGQIFKYETLIDDAEAFMMSMCEFLNLTYDDSFQDIFDAFEMTGNSGRQSGLIKIRKRRELSDELCKEIQKSEHYKIICEQFDY